MPMLARPETPLTDGFVAVRPFDLGDVSAVTAACQDREISRWTATIPWPYKEEDARWWIATHEGLWESGEGAEFAVVGVPNGRFLGAVGLRPFDWKRRTAGAGYWVAAWARGQGVATRALRLATEWGIDRVGLSAVELVTMTGNVASEHVADKAEFEMLEEIADYQLPIASDQRYHVKRWVRLAANQ